MRGHWLHRGFCLAGVLLIAAMAAAAVPQDEIAAELAAAAAWEASPVYAAKATAAPAGAPAAPEAIVYFSDFEADNGGLIGTLDWQWGVYAWVGSTCGTTQHNPTAPYSGTHMWGTVLNDCYTGYGNNGGYATCTNTNPADDSILTLSVDLTGLPDATLTWWEWYDLFSNWDWAEVYANGTQVFPHCESSYTAPTAWVQQTVNLTPFVGGVVTIEFHMMASTVVNYTGWYLDDVSVTTTAGGGPQNINVSPLSLSSTQAPDTVTTLPLTIGNTGDQALTWAILEEGAPDFVDWFDNFDSYATGSQLHGQGGWKGWGNSAAAGALTSSVQAHSVPNSAAILGASDLVHEYAGYTTGPWVYTAWQYVPTDFTGTTYFILLNSYDDPGTNLNWSVQVSFDAATNLVANDGPAGGTLPLVKGQWVEIRDEIDLTLDTQSFYYNNTLLFTTTWTGGMSGGGALNIGAVDLFANNASVVYYDDVSLAAPGVPDVCDLPSDVPWLSTAPSAGTTPGWGTTPVEVGLDSTGLPIGTYNANLCVTSDDPDPGPGNGTDLVVVPVELIVAPGTNPAISLVKTVGTTAGVCATTSNITVAEGTTVYYCYEVTNTGDVTFTTHDLMDDLFGGIFTGFAYSLPPGASANTVEDLGLTVSTTINATTTNTATWTAHDAAGAPTQATASATVNVGGVNPAIVLTKTVGTVAGVCATTDEITVATGTDVYYCYQVENTGDMTFEVHDLVDDQLGTILDGFAYTLPPGAQSPEVIVPDTVTGPVVNTATWTAMGPPFAVTGFSFIDISTSGTPLGLTDDGEANITLPFAFTLFGVSSSDLRVANNGGILFGVTTGDLSTANTALPNASIGRAILPFWDDIDADTGNVYWEVQGSAPNRVAIVEWYNRPHFSNTGSATFEVLLYEGSNAIVFQYLDTDFGNASYNAGASATVGLNDSASNALQYSFNQAVITDGLALVHDPILYGIATSTDSATVNTSDPDIEVTPTSMASTLLVGTTDTQVLTIGNVGAGVLNWNIDEAPVAKETGRREMAGVAGLGDLMVAEERASDFPAPKPTEFIPEPVAWSSPDAVIYDNGPLVTHPGGGAGGADASALQTALGMNTYGAGAQFSAGNRVADDFTVTDSGGWAIETITFFTYQTGSGTTSTITGLNLRIWDGPPNAGGSVVWGDTSTNIMASTTWSMDYRVLDTALTNADRPIMAVVGTVNTVLPAGTYWLDWQFDGTLSSGPWQPPISILGQTTTGNAMQYTSTGWANLTDTGTLTPQGLPFVIEGSASECSAPADVPWLSVSPDMGTTAPGGSTPVDVTFDATVVGVGTYEALLCVFSNDPNDPMVEVPVTMEVVIPVELMEISIE
ncbi:MAG TPA: hypothetical protein PKJ99_04385 [Thermoanaerobaculales bacterium]|nr:hypothetical protein [Thermoanaerobaculales bacterium]